MNNLSSQVRKLIYLGVIACLMIVNILLGRPAASETDEGGVLPQKRVEYELGESTLGDVDPSSETMNYLLLGLRGIAVNVLWQEHGEAKDTKNWATMKTLANSIVVLQPHFLKVWTYHSWDLAYNVSAQWDGVNDRYFWVKEGIKFAKRGEGKNRKYSELPYEVGRMLGQKVGRADEWRFFRKYFLKDPDPQFENGPDTEINPDGKDNYLAAYDTYTRACEVDREYQSKRRQRIMMPALFYHYPARSKFDYANALQREGIFNERTEFAWADAYDEWINNYGQQVFKQSNDYGFLKHEASPEEIQEMAAQEWNDERLRTKLKNERRVTSLEDWKPLKVRDWIGLQNITNYRYWKGKSDLERQNDMVVAHREMYEGRQAYKRGQSLIREDPQTGEPILPASMVLLESGMKKFSRMLKQAAASQVANSDELSQDDSLIEEGMLAVYYWQTILNNNGLPIPDDYPLKWLWDSQQGRIPQIKQEFVRDTNPDYGPEL